MGRALAADVVVVTDVYAARESPVPGVSGQSVADAARGAGREVHWVPSRSELSERVVALVREGDVVLTLGAGDITGAGREILALLKARQGAPV